MAHIVFITSGIVSIRNPNLEFASRLAAAGHRITYASPADIGDEVRTCGFPFVPVGPRRDDQLPRFRSRRSWRARLARLPALRRRREDAVDALGIEGFVDTFRGLEADLALIDIELHPYVISATPLGTPVALLSTWLAIWKSRGLPPLHRYILPGEGWRGGSMNVRWAWLRFRLWKWAHRRLEWLRRGGVDRTNVLKALAARTGFPFDEEADFGQWLIPFSYRTLPVLCLNVAELDLPHEPPPNALYVGPMISDPQSDPTLDDVAVEDRSRLNALLEPRRKMVDSRPLVYVAFGAFFRGDDAAFIRQVVSAMANRPHWDVVLGLGARVKPSALGLLPTHIQAFAWTPQPAVLQVADAAIVHAGITTLNECVRFGVPMVVYPLETTDQMGNAARIAFHGLGVVGDRNRDKADSIRHHVESILADDECRQRVRAMQARIRAYERADRGAEAVKALLNQ